MNFTVFSEKFSANVLSCCTATQVFSARDFFVNILPAHVPPMSIRPWLVLCLVFSLVASPQIVGAQTPSVYNVQSYGAVGNGSTDDTAAVNAAITACHNAGGGTVWFPATPNGYAIGRQNSANQSGGGIALRSGVNLKGDQTKIVLTSNCDFIWAVSPTGAQAVIQKDTVATDTTLAVDSSGGFSIGDNVQVEIGQASYDTGEPDAWFFATVAAVPDSTHLTLDRPVAYALNAASVTNSYHKSVFKITEFLDGNSIDGFYLYGGDSNANRDGAENGINAMRARNLHIANISGYNVGAGLVGLQYCSNVEIMNTSIKKCDALNNQGSKGRCFSFAEANAVQVFNCYAANFQNTFALLENRSSVHFQGIKLVNNFPGRNQAESLFGSLSYCQATVDDLTVEGNPTTLYASNMSAPNGAADMTVRDLNWQAVGLPEIDNMNILEGRVNINAGYLAGYYWKDYKEYHLSVTLISGMNGSTYIPLPAGLYRSVRAYASSTNGLNGIYVDGGAGNDEDIAPLLHAGNSRLLSYYVNLSSNSHFNNGLGGRWLIPYTGTVDPNTTLTLDIQYWPLDEEGGSLAAMASLLPGQTMRGISPQEKLKQQKLRVAFLHKSFQRISHSSGVGVRRILRSPAISSSNQVKALRASREKIAQADSQ